jgi:beta-lactamase regulating signal transducer with metallopeptidase domain
VTGHVILLIADATVRVTILLAGGWALTALMRRASASARHFAWMCTIVIAGAMPAATIVMPDWKVPYLSRLTAVAAPAHPPLERTVALPAVDDSEQPASASSQPAAGSSEGIPYSTLAFVTWIAGSCGVAFYLFSGVLAVRRLRRRATIAVAPWADEARTLARSLGIPESVVFLESAMTEVPMVCGLWRPAVAMPSGASAWPPDRLRVAVLHELAHVRRHDCLTQALAQLICALYWFSPLVWLAARRLRAERERACDDFVLEAWYQRVCVRHASPGDRANDGATNSGVHTRRCVDGARVTTGGTSHGHSQSRDSTIERAPLTSHCVDGDAARRDSRCRGAPTGSGRDHNPMPSSRLSRRWSSFTNVSGPVGHFRRRRRFSSARQEANSSTPLSVTTEPSTGRSSPLPAKATWRVSTTSSRPRPT